MKKYLPLLLLLLSLTLHAQPLQRVAPELVGMDSHQLLFADQAIQKAIADKQIPGAVLAVVRHGKMAYIKAYGNRRIYPTTEPMTVNTIFDMASCTKPTSTAMCIMKLVEQGLIRLVDPVSLYIPNFKNWQSEDGKNQTTIRLHHLMTHSSGLPPYVSPIDLQKKYGKADPQVLIDYIANCRRDFEPATDFQYSCLNFITLQHVVENVTGMSLRQFARQNIFGPLGMNHTDYMPCKLADDGNWVNTDYPCWATPEEKQREKLSDENAMLHADFLKDVAPTEKQTNGQVLWGQVHDPLARVANNGISGNAGLFTTADDLGLLCAMMQNGGEWNGHRILSPLSVKAMRTVPREEASLGRTLGWDCFTAYASNNGDLLSPHTYSHSGYTGTSIVIDPDNDISIILLINAVHPEDKTNVVRLRSLVSNAVAAAILPEDSVHAPKYTAHYYDRVTQFMEEPDITPKDIVMLGNSLTENGGNWATRLGKANIRNRGIIGDEAQGVYDRLYQILPYHPAKIFLMIGINDVSHNLSTDSITQLVQRIVEKVRTDSPQTKLYLQSLLPINESFGRYSRLKGKTAQIPQINDRLRSLAKNKKIAFIDLFPKFCDKNSLSLRADLSTDGLHLQESGYKIWVKALKGQL
jgi:CubicO group peptidase (beta-lactamase class C family)/lysophospholipase L1-like esterase